MTDIQKSEETPTITGKSPDMTQNPVKKALLEEPGNNSMRLTPVETHTNILTVPQTEEHGSQNRVESYSGNLTPPSDNKKKTSQIVHSINNKTMKLKNQAPPPSTKGKSKPKVTGTNRRKSTRKNEAGSGSKLKAPPKLTRTSETNAFATSTTKKQKCTCSPTKSPMKKTKQKYYNVTPMEEDETWKTVLGKAYCKTKKVLNGNDSDDEWPTDANFFPSDDELDNSDNEVKFTKKMKVQPKTVLSSSDEEDDAEVKIVGVKKAKENYYKNLAPTTNEEDESEDDEEDEDDDREEEAGDVPPTFDTHTATKFGYKDSSVDLSSDEKESKDEDPSSKESPSEEESSASDNKSTSNTSAHSNKKKQKRIKTTRTVVDTNPAKK
jgi:hypothetical protein